MSLTKNQLRTLAGMPTTSDGDVSLTIKEQHTSKRFVQENGAQSAGDAEVVFYCMSFYVEDFDAYTMNEATNTANGGSIGGVVEAPLTEKEFNNDCKKQINDFLKKIGLTATKISYSYDEDDENGYLEVDWTGKVDRPALAKLHGGELLQYFSDNAEHYNLDFKKYFSNPNSKKRVGK